MKANIWKPVLAAVLSVATIAAVAAEQNKQMNNSEPQEMVSELCIGQLAGEFSHRVVYQSAEVIQAPNWSPDGKWLVYNSAGKLYKIPADGSTEPAEIPAGSHTNISNDHLISPDGQWIYYSKFPHIYRLPFAGGTPEQITLSLRTGLSSSAWLHGISLDGKTLVFCGVDPEKKKGDIWLMDSAGGSEKLLYASDGHEDGPNFSADGKWVYFNSDQTGNAQIYRIATAGGEAERLTQDSRVNWFPHPQPTGEKFIYLSYPAGTEGHPPNLPVQIHSMPLDGGQASVELELFGGNGTMNSPCWKADGSAFAFVKYRKKPDQ